jgi:hypothetical protein
MKARRMRWATNAARMKRDQLEDLRVDRELIFKRILNNSACASWTFLAEDMVEAVLNTVMKLRVVQKAGSS